MALHQTPLEHPASFIAPSHHPTRRRAQAHSEEHCMNHNGALLVLQVCPWCMPRRVHRACPGVCPWCVSRRVHRACLGVHLQVARRKNTTMPGKALCMVQASVA
eukprot:1138996-Pelagomonas_calceolata.AAC.1